MANHDEQGSFVDAVYTIGVTSRMVGVHAQTLRYYERVGLITPARSQGQIRFYSPQDVERLRQIKTLIADLGVNLAGVDVILRLTERMLRMDRRMKYLEQTIQQLTGREVIDEGEAHETR